MTGAWPGGLQWGNPVAYGTATTTAGTPAFTKGSWSQVTASTTADSTWAQVMIRCAASPGPASVIDIGIGAAGSEVVVAANLIYSAVYVRTVDYLLPLQIPAGTRIAVRSSSSTASEVNAVVQFVTFDDTFISTGGPSGVDTYGFVSATNLGTLIDPGVTPNTKGSYAQLTASTTDDIAGFFMGFDNQTDPASGSVGNLYWLVDIAVGGAGSEQPILPNYLLFGYSVNGIALVNNMASPYFPMKIPAGSRLAARSQCSTATSPDRRMGITFYGVRQ